MRYDFNADDVFEMAEQLERNGAKFYWDSAASVEGDSAKELLVKLASMEMDHEKTFIQMRADLAEAYLRFLFGRVRPHPKAAQRGAKVLRAIQAPAAGPSVSTSANGAVKVSLSDW